MPTNDTSPRLDHQVFGFVNNIDANLRVEHMHQSHNDQVSILIKRESCRLYAPMPMEWREDHYAHGHFDTALLTLCLANAARVHAASLAPSYRGRFCHSDIDWDGNGTRYFDLEVHRVRPQIDRDEMNEAIRIAAADLYVTHRHEARRHFAEWHAPLTMLIQKPWDYRDRWSDRDEIIKILSTDPTPVFA